MSAQVRSCGPKRFIQFGEGKKCRSNYTCADTSGSSNPTKERCVAAVTLALRAQAVHPIPQRKSVVATALARAQAVHTVRRKMEVSVQQHLCGPERFIQSNERKRAAAGTFVGTQAVHSNRRKEGSVAATTLVRRTQAIIPTPRRKKCRRHYTCAGSSGPSNSTKNGSVGATTLVRPKRFIQFGEERRCRSN